MKSEIVINVQNRETRAAIVEDGRLAEVYVERAERAVGSIYKCRVRNVLSGMDAAFVDIGTNKNAFLYSGDILSFGADSVAHEHKPGKKSRITGLVKQGDELLVQVIKAPRAAKGARVSARITLPGRYTVLMPEGNIAGVSKKISEEERERLKAVLEKIRPEGFGVIARTEAEGRTEQELAADIGLMTGIWQTICQRAAGLQAPALVYQELSLIYRIIRDNLTAETSCMYIDSQKEFAKAGELARLLAPGMAGRIKYYRDKQPIFEHFGLERDYQQLFRRKIWLRNGSYICIDIAEALTVIDVNTGKFVGKKSFKDTVLDTNLQAAAEIARQIRLRDLGGIIIVDFIDMTNPRDEERLLAAFREALAKERTGTFVSQVSPLGLVELNRKRVSETVGEAVTEVCPCCGGRGRIESSETISLRIERDLRSFLRRGEPGFAVHICADPDTACYLIGDEGRNLKELEELHGIPIYVRAGSFARSGEYSLNYITEEQAGKLSTVTGERLYTVYPRQSFLSEDDKAYAWVDGFLVELPGGAKYAGKSVKIRVKAVYGSYGTASIRPGG